MLSRNGIGEALAFARGKIILLGEHAVVYGHPAIAAAIDVGVTATAAPAESDELFVPTWSKSIRPDATSEDALERAVAVAFSERPASRPRLRVTADVGLPAGAGLGCSAALGVAVLAAIDDALGTPRSPESLAEASFAWEKVFHGNPSGIDNTVAALGGIVVFRRGDPLERILPKRPIPLVVAFSGESCSTQITVASVARQRERKPTEVNECFDAIASVVRNGRIAIGEGDLVGLGQLFDVNHMLLSSLMLSTAKLEALCAVSRSAGALGAKLTGGGGGGCMIALAKGRDEAGPILEALRAEGVSPFYVEAGA